MDSIRLLTVILTIVLGIMVILLAILGIVYISSRKRSEKTQKIESNNTKSKTRKYKDYTIQSVMDFMEFDTVIDNMISQRNGNRYIMVVACQGINYDLMSEMEKNAVEEGFIQFLNTLRYPIQIYTQTRTINLDSSIQTYREKVKDIENSLAKQETRYKEMVRSEKYTQAQLDKAYYELVKQRNLYDYGKDIIFDTEKMSLNKNVLNQKYYVVIPYFIEELGENQFDKEERRSLAFSELYTRAQAIIRALGVCGVNAKVMSSTELVELLYMAYNRDLAEVYGVDKAIRAGYDEMYTTAPDVIDKQMKLLDRQIEEAAVEKAKSKVSEARSEKQKKLEEKRDNKQDLIDELARIIIEENAEMLGEDIAESAIEKVNEEGGTKDNVQDQKTKRNRKTRTA